MEKLKSAQKVLRSSFTKAYNAFQIERKKSSPDLTKLQTQFALIRDKASELGELSHKIQDAMLDADEEEEILIKEVENADEYTAKYHQTKIELSDLVEAGPSQMPVPQPIIITSQESIRVLKLPKIELRKFGGEIKDWLSFWSTFRKIHEDATLSREDKFHYLLQSTVKDSRAFEVVNSFPPTADNYEKAVESLKSRFGKKDLLIEFYVRELLKLVLNKSKNISLISIYDKLETHLRALESLGVTTDMCAAMLFPLVESSLPEEILRTWQRAMATMDVSITNVTAKDRLMHLMAFLDKEVESEERIHMAKTCFETNDDSTKSKDKKKLKGDRNQDIVTAAGLLTVKETSTLKCLFCEEPHDSLHCGKARSMSVEQRITLIKNKHEQSESAFNEVSSGLANISLDAKVFLPMLKVKLRGSKGTVNARAVIDTGSHKSYILNRAAEELDYKTVGEQTMVHLLFGGARTKPQNRKACRIYLEHLDGSYKCDFIVFQQEVICHSTPKSNNKPWKEALRQNKVQLSDDGEGDEPITVLIGVDIAGRLFTGKLLQLDNNITAIETKLGWTLMGRNLIDKNKEDTTLMIVSMMTENASVSDLWKLDALGITDPIESKTKEARQAEVKILFRD
ncbi:hypothetical protein ALC62_01968 [Cyphomyrmex costatus]|uniref:Uncharacterized protein n=1 Tax=Cyphomyrmex costatus TaxID=456900 RepID=A0A151INM2_9HYME|nr:hypothetical protein ALC62_01968 [Cyphomyrmex costatus]